MNSVTENSFKTQIGSLKDSAFQAFIDKLYTVVYGNDFTVVKQKHDQGCDGIVNNETVLAVYAPGKYDFKKFRKKISDDFEKYSENWVNRYPQWQVVYNGDFTASIVQVIQSLKVDAQRVGISNLIEMIAKLRWSQIQDLAEYLKIDVQFIVFDIVDEIIKDSLKAEPAAIGEFDFSKRTELQEKIEFNFNQKDIDAAKAEFLDYLKYFWLVTNVISGYESQEDALKNRIRMDLAKFSGDFKIKLQYLTEYYTQKRPNDDYYKLFVRVLLLYLFEQCIIGKSKQG